MLERHQGTKSFRLSVREAAFGDNEWFPRLSILSRFAFIVVYAAAPSAMVIDEDAISVNDEYWERVLGDHSSK